jgi:hypothetical protein
MTVNTVNIVIHRARKCGKGEVGLTAKYMV